MRPDEIVAASVDRRQYGPLEAVARLRAARLGREAMRIAWWETAAGRAGLWAWAVVPWVVWVALLLWRL